MTSWTSPPDTARKEAEHRTFTKEMAETRLPEFLLSFALVLDGFIVPGLNFPASLLAAGVLIFVGLQRRSRYRIGSISGYAWLLVAVMVYVGVLSALSPGSSAGTDWTRRIMRIVGLLVVVLLMGAGRLHIASMLRGITAGLLVNAALFYLKLAPDEYSGALTGYLLDKNKAGLFYAVIGVLAIAQAKWGPWRVATTALFGAFVWLTESRTSIMAFSYGLIWVWFVARRAAAFRWLIAGVMIFAAGTLEDNLARTGVFENRTGSDLLRARIDAAAAIKLEGAPWQGIGLGQAYVVIGENKWFFHNAYDTLRIEGGWVYFLGVLVFTVFVGLRPFHEGERRAVARVGQGAVVAILVCAWKLGEVFLTIPWAIALGTALYGTMADRAHLFPMPDTLETGPYRDFFPDLLESR